MQQFPFDLSTLTPQETKFTLGDAKGKEFTLCRWSLRVRAWATEKYTSEGLNVIFTNLDIGKIADIAWFMLKEESKKEFANDYETFLDSVSSVQDQTNLVKALLGAVGIGEPEMKRIKASLDNPVQKKTQVMASTPEKMKSQSKTTGSKSSIR